jgi:hypothetical protein
MRRARAYATQLDSWQSRNPIALRCYAFYILAADNVMERESVDE